MAKKVDAGFRCANCDEEGVAFSCARCLKARYCGAACQKAHWVNTHKALCFTSAECSVKAQPAATDVLDACTICQDALTTATRALLPCGHADFHIQCIFQLVDAKCPLCRAEFERAREIMDRFTPATHARMLVTSQTDPEFIEYRDAMFSAHNQGSMGASQIIVKLFFRMNPRFILGITKLMLDRNPSSPAIRYLLKLSLFLNEFDTFATYLSLYLSSFADSVQGFNSLKEKFLRPKTRANRIYISDLQTLYHVLIHILNRSFLKGEAPPVTFLYLKMLESVGLARSLLGRELIDLGEVASANPILCEALAYYNKVLEMFPQGCFLMVSDGSGETIDYTSIQTEVIKNAICVREFAVADALAAQLLERCPNNEFALGYRISRMFGLPFVV